MLRKNLLIILLAICALSALCSERYRRSETLGGNEVQETLGHVASDGWTDGQFSILLGTRVATVERIVLSIDPYRPKGVAKSSVSLINCPTATLTQNFTEVVINDAWNCSTEILLRTDKISKLIDGRHVGIKLKSVRFEPSWRILDKGYAKVLLLLIGVSSLAFFCVGKTSWQSFIAALFFQTFLSFTNAHRYWDSSHEYVYLCVLIGSILFGLKYFSQGRLGPDGIAEDITDKTFWIVLLGIAALGFGLRAYGIHFGLPNLFHPDEPRKARIAFGFVTTGDLNPNYFLHPTFLLYLTALFAKIGSLLALVDEVTKQYVLVCGRVVSVVAGSISIILCALCGKILGKKKTALLAAAVVAFSPLTVTCSRYLKEDALVLCMLLSCLLFCLLAATRPNKRVLFCCLASLFAGFAAGSKYSGIVCAGFVCLAPWMASKNFYPDKKLLQIALATLILAPIGFLITTPYSVVTPDKFLADFNSERKHMSVGHDNVQILASHRYWLFHASRSLTEGMGFWVVPLLGLLFAEAYRRRSIPLLIVLSCFMLFYLPAEFVKAKPEPQPERYVLPCVALLALAMSCSSLFLKAKPKSFAILSLVAILPAAVMSFRLASEIYPDTRILMRHFIMRKILPQKTILIDAAIYSAPLPDNVYKIIGISSKEDRESLTPEWLSKHNVNYVLLTSKSWQRYFDSRITNRTIRARYRVLLHKLALVKQIKADYKSYGFHNPDLRLYKVD